MFRDCQVTGRALFLDRDGTLVHPRHYPSRPEDLVLYDGIENPLVALQAAGFQTIVVTNQSGIARGLFSPADLERMHRSLETDLKRRGIHVDAIYHCPHHREGTIPALAIDCECRKPRPGMLLQAARDLDIDLSSSWFVGDILDDVEAGNRAGCRTILVDLDTESSPETDLRRPDYVARDTVHALEIIRDREGLGAHVDSSYRPHSWRDIPALAGERHGAG